MGGGRLFHFISRFQYLSNLTANNWLRQRGFEGGKKYQLDGVDIIESINDNKPEIIENYTIYSNNLKEKKLYTPPYIALRHVIGDESLSACLVDKHEKQYLYFGAKLIGIKPPNSNLYKLKIFYNQLTSYQPDKLNYYRHLGKSLNKRGKILHQKVTENQLQDYGKAFCMVMNGIYEEKDEQENIMQSWQAGKVYQTPQLTFFQFIYKKTKEDSFQFEQKAFHDLDNSFQKLIFNTKENKGAIYHRVVKVYDHLDSYDCVYFVKPNALRYWLGSIGLRDADEVIWEMYEEGY